MPSKAPERAARKDEAAAGRVARQRGRIWAELLREASGLVSAAHADPVKRQAGLQDPSQPLDALARCQPLTAKAAPVSGSSSRALTRSSRNPGRRALPTHHTPSPLSTAREGPRARPRGRRHAGQQPQDQPPRASRAGPAGDERKKRVRATMGNRHPILPVKEPLTPAGALLHHQRFSRNGTVPAASLVATRTAFPFAFCPSKGGGSTFLWEPVAFRSGGGCL